LSLKVCDPACGSGHFLIAAAHRIAKRLAAVRTGDEEPAPEAYRLDLRRDSGAWKCHMRSAGCQIRWWSEAFCDFTEAERLRQIEEMSGRQNC
jgi:hypothetical protein